MNAGIYIPAKNSLRHKSIPSIHEAFQTF